MIRVLAIDDEEPFRRLLKKELTRKGFHLDTAEGAEPALSMLRDSSYDAILLDILMPGMDGITLMKKLKTLPGIPPIILLTGKATIETAVEAMKHGAYDYMTNPFKLDEIEIILNRAFEYFKLQRKNEMLEQEMLRHEGSEEMIGKSPQLARIRELVRKVAPTDTTALITGESGTGKELVAKAIWRGSSRSASLFTALNCATLSAELIESELFGHEKGAFTTAYRTKFGIVEAVDKGTLLLDEVGELPHELQSKLLRFLDSGEFRRVGGNNTLKVDVRVIAATNKDLKSLVEMGRFRVDFYYRLNVINIEVPPLRARKEDIYELVKYSIEKFSRKFSKAIKGVNADAMEMLVEYPWPGNIRELENEMERAVLLCESDMIGSVDLKLGMESSPRGILEPPGDEEEEGYPELREVEREYIAKVLKETGGNQSKASAILGINRKTLYLKIKKYGLDHA